MSKLLAVIGLAAGVAALSGCVVVPAHHGYGYGHGHGYRHYAPPAVIVAPGPDYRYRRGYYPPRW